MNQRERALAQLENNAFDVLVIGGGINGAAATLALAAHGVVVGCASRDDFAAGTSQQSSNLMWGGFKYLEGYEIPLVAKLCASRNRLAKAFPTRLVETRFLATLDTDSPHSPWFAAFGAYAYWSIGRFFTRRPRHRRAGWIASAEPCVDTSRARGGIEYSDYVIVDNDARFVAQLFFDAADRGAAVANHTEVVAAEWDGSRWSVDLEDRPTGRRITARARALVNAAGPWIESVGSLTHTTTQKQIVLSKGVHLIVPQLTASRRVLAFYDDSHRLFYVLPMGHRSVIGTTDTRTNDAGEGVTDEDRRMVLDQINKRLTLAEPLDIRDIIAERVGVRPLLVDRERSVVDSDWTSLSRRHAVEVDTTRNVISILGGKLTDCANVGAEVVAEAGRLGVAPTATPDRHWFGEPGAAEREVFCRRAEQTGLDWRPRFEPESTHAEVVWRRYGKRAWAVIERAAREPSLAASMMGIADYCEAEIRHVGDEEWIVTAEDFLRRRTPLLQLNKPAELAADPGVRRAVELLLGETGSAALQQLAASQPT